jgi:transcriptional regulator with XRE-family HTH domain
MANPGGTTTPDRSGDPGEGLRRIRMRLGLSTRTVAGLSRMVASAQGSLDFAISHARLVQIENQKSIPSIHKLFTLSCVYGIAVQELFELFFNPKAAGQIHASIGLPNTHLASFETPHIPKTIPFPCLPNSAPQASASRTLSKVISGRDEFAARPDRVEKRNALYGFIGLSDYTMDPLIPPGSLVQIEECRKIADAAPYRSESERPIYFLESRSGYLCSWCSMEADRFFSIPYPLSPCPPRVFAYPSEVEVVGRVTGVALRLERGSGVNAGASHSGRMQSIRERERAIAG